MIICVDIGNTLIHCAIGALDGYKRETIETNEIHCVNCFTAFINDKFGPDVWDKLKGGVISSVVPDKKTIIVETVKKKNKKILMKSIDFMNYGIDFSKYEGNLGEDRVVCCFAAIKKYETPVVVDFGTATTVNVIDENKVFLGGAILAGVQTGIKALSNGTAQLPLIDDFTEVEIIGNGTKECIKSGAVMGTVFAVEGYIKRVAERTKNTPTIILTGGNATKVMPYCDFKFVYEPSLIMEGLFMIYENE